MSLSIPQACKPRALSLLLLLPKFRLIDFSKLQGYVFGCEIGIAEVLILLGVAGPVKRSLGKIGKKAGIEQYYNGYIIYFNELCS